MVDRTVRSKKLMCMVLAWSFVQLLCTGAGALCLVGRPRLLFLPLFAVFVVLVGWIYSHNRKLADPWWHKKQKRAGSAPLDGGE